MKNILLPTDFSENSLNAIEYAMEFFKHWECDFYILNIQKAAGYISADLVSGAKGDSIYDSIAGDNKKLINELKEDLTQKNKSKSYHFHGLFDYDDFISAVEQVVKIHAIDLIVMGTNGATGAKEAIFGSNTVQVIRNIDCPTLTIPEQYRLTSVKKALFSFKKHEDLSSKQIGVFREILNKYQCELNVMEINDDSTTVEEQDNINVIKSLFPQYKYTYHALKAVPSLIAVNTATQLLKIDIHAVSLENKTFLERLISGSETSQLSYDSLVPLLFLH